MGLNFISEWITLIYRRTIGKMSSGKNREGMGAWFIFAEWEFGAGWKPYSERNNAKGPRVSCESSSPTQQCHCEFHRDSGTVTGTLGEAGAISFRHWDPSTKWVFGTQICPWMPAQIHFETLSRPPSIMEVLQKFHWHWVKSIWTYFPGICLEKMLLWTMLEKGAAAGMWVHVGSDHLCQGLLHPTEHSWPYSCCLLGGICRWFILYTQAKNIRNTQIQSSILGYYKELLWSSISTLNFLSKLLHLQY